jgi:hypothetical protein
LPFADVVRNDAIHGDLPDVAVHSLLDGYDRTNGNRSSSPCTADVHHTKVAALLINCIQGH